MVGALREDVAEDRGLTHPFVVSEAFVGMMVTPSVRLVRPLGEGGMGAVWVADHLALRTQVVVKFIAHGLKGSKEAQERFSREAAAAAQVKSPHVVQTFDHGITDEGIPYIVMELLDGHDLGQHLEREGAMPPEQVLEVIGQLARALDRAHEKGIIHRDIKPGNIFLSDVGRSGEVFVKLLDFGIAKGVDLLGGSGNAIDSGTKTGSMVGSPFYMSPEQILGAKNLDHRSDVWSLGVVTYEMLTGKKPFDAETMGGLAIKIHSEPLPVPTRANPALPAAIDAWFASACARDVAQRFGSATELATELARALGGELPRSLSPARMGTGGNRRAVALADRTLLDGGAATDAGLASSTHASSVRSRLLVLFAIVACASSVAFFVVRAVKKPAGAALVAADGPSSAPHAEPSLATGAPHAEPSAAALAAGGSSTPAAPASGPAAPAPGAASEPGSAAAGALGKRPAARPRAGTHPAVTGSTSASSTSPKAPDVPAPAPRPSNDIF
ncbi:MAG: Serine/threonine protein kinase PrkC, regulator of stationary phase [Labilithrix sp.]|nr:Serine/threonine protein kinase PrkC, regulator of stationary phase [Labilithrix sp.]